MCLLTDIAISGDRNVIIKKEAEESLKHKDLTTEVQCMWNVISDTSNNRGIWNHLKITQTIPEQHNRKAQHQLQKSAILSAIHILREVVMY